MTSPSPTYVLSSPPQVSVHSAAAQTSTALIVLSVSICQGFHWPPSQPVALAVKVAAG